ncbi:unnamed protein product [Calypogeia fissa]
MTIKVYGAPLSSGTSLVLATLVEKGVTDYELVTVDMMHGAHKAPEFLAMQPFGLVPVMVDGPLTLFESRAIARVVAHKYEGQGTPLYGFSPKDRALVEQWLEVEGQNFQPVVVPIMVEKFRKPMMGQQPDETAVQNSVEKLHKVLDVYEAHLMKSKYLAGDFFSLADLSQLPYLYQLSKICELGYVVEAKPHVKAWWEECSSRPAWKQVAALAQDAIDKWAPK